MGGGDADLDHGPVEALIAAGYGGLRLDAVLGGIDEVLHVAARRRIASLDGAALQRFRIAGQIADELRAHAAELVVIVRHGQLQLRVGGDGIGRGRIGCTYLGDGLIDTLDGAVQLGVGELVHPGLRNGLQLGVERRQLLGAQSALLGQQCDVTIGEAVVAQEAPGLRIAADIELHQPERIGACAFLCV